MKFVDDEIVIGKWEYVDVVNSISQFDYKNIKNQVNEKGFDEIYFLPNGKGYWIFEGWTKGFLAIHYGGDDPILTYQYSTKNIDGCDYMFIEVKNEDDDFVNVLKKVSSKRFQISDFVRRENINLPFINDERIVGKWNTVAYVEHIDDFPQNVNFEQTLWLEYIDFKSNGEVRRKYFEEEEWIDKWTKGMLLDQKKSVASKYVFKVIENKEYMFLEWKMGNYIYAGRPATYYVFVRSF